MTIIYPSVRPSLSWKHLQLSDDLGRVEGVVDEATIRAHAFAIGDDPERYLEGIGDSGPFVPPSLVANDLLKIFMVGYDCTPPWEGGFHARSQVDYLAKIPLGASITITGTHIAKFRKRGRVYRSIQSEARLADGTTAVRLIATESMGYVVTQEPDEGAPPADWTQGWPRIGAELAQDDARAVGSQTHLIGMAESAIFSGYPFSWAYDSPQWIRAGLHTDPAIAAKAGFPAPVVQGQLSASHLTSIFLDLYGAKAAESVSLSLVFISSTLVGDRLTSRAVPIGGLREEPTFSLLSSRQNGEVVAAGYGMVR